MSVTGSTVAVEDGARPLEDAEASAARLHVALVRDYPGLMRVLARRLGDRQLALDVLQDAVVTTLGKLSSGTAVSPEVLAGYVFRTAMNHVRNHRRRERTWSVESDALDHCADDGPSPADVSQRDATRRLVRRALAALASARDREVLVRFYLDEQGKEQICADLGLSSLQFNQVLFRARERMRRGLESVGLRPWDLAAVVLAVLACHPFG